MHPQPVEKKSVNLLGLRAPGGRKIEPVRLLEGKGITIRNVIPSNSTPAEISRAPGAQLNIVLEHYALPLAEKMKKDFGTEYIYCERPYAPDSIEGWYLQMAEALDIDFGCDLRVLRQKVKEDLYEMKNTFAGKTYVLGVQQGRSIDLGRLLALLGMEPILIYANRILPDDLNDIRSLLAYGVDPLVMKSGDALQNERLLAELKPDYFIGLGDRRLLARLNIKARNLIPAYYSPGFAGTEQVLRLLCRPQAGSEILYYKEQFIRNAEAG